MVAVIGAAVAGVNAGKLEFGVRFEVKDGMLPGTLWARLVARLSAMTNPVSGALAVFAAAVVAVCGAAAGPGCTETPGLALLVASCFVRATGAGVISVVAIGTGSGAGAFEFGARFGVRGGALLLGMLLEILFTMLSVRLGAVATPACSARAVCAAAVLVALDGRTRAGAVARVAEPGVGAGSAAVELPGKELPGAELLSPTGNC